MSEFHDPKTDPRSIEDLFLAALTESDEDTAWNAVVALHCKGTREVLLRAESLCKGYCSFERRVGADLLGQLGVPDRTYPNECAEILFEMLKKEDDADVLQAILVAMSHQDIPNAVDSVIRFSDHPDSSVRHAVVLALSGYEVPLAISTLITLTTDQDNEVRDWATFALGSQIETDTPEIRDTLAACLKDADDDTRAEALVGLARRKDQRVIPALQIELGRELISRLAVEAAELASFPDLLPYLISLRKKSEIPSELLERAICACTPPESAVTGL